ncbi:ubiquitin-specific protease otu1 [Gamsiella multidivaricata]|nr:ubiquitin-specific protease otu1 [Gamsiella multidivaricata]
MRLRIRHKEGTATLTTLSAQSTLLELHSEIAREIKAPVDRLELKFGYPPKLIVIDETTAHSSLESLGIRDGEQILTSEWPEGSAATFNFSSSHFSVSAAETATEATMATATSFPPTSSKHAGISALGASTESGGGSAFGSRAAVHSTGAQSTFQVRAATESPAGGHSSDGPSYKPTPAFIAVPPMLSSGAVDAIRIRDQGFLVVREVEDDNSCLFNAIAYTLDPSMKENIKGLRQIIAQAIEANPEVYPDVVLGEKSWGGAIELAIFSEHYNIEIDSIDVATNRVDRFDYDAVALTPGLDIPAECDQTQFDTTFDDIIVAGTQLAAKLKKAHKYTDLATFTLRCSVCQVGLKGEKDAQQHAQQTMHTSLYVLCWISFSAVARFVNRALIPLPFLFPLNN